jgi:heptosyltransferase-1
MKVLILKVSAIGDVIHSLPVVFYLKKCCPSVQISWVVQEKAAALLLDQPFLDNVFVLPDKFLKIKNWGKTFKVLKELRKTEWDAILDLQGIHKTTVLLSFLKGKKYGFCRKLARSRFSTRFTDKHVCTEFKNIIQKNLAVASQVGQDLFKTAQCPTVQELRKEFSLSFTERRQQSVNNWLNINKVDKFILLCPNTTWATKHWPEELWVEFVAKFSEQDTGYKILLVGKDFGTAAQEIAKTCTTQKLPIFLTPAWDLNTTAYLISKSGLLIAPDTGLLHLADFLNVATIGIFGPTSKDLQGPFLKNENMRNAIQVYNFQDSIESNGSNFQKATTSKSSMYKLQPDMLLKKVLQILNV